MAEINRENKDLLDDCRSLRDYSWLIDLIRTCQAECNDVEKAVDMAVAEPDDNSVLKDLILVNKAESRV